MKTRLLATMALAALVAGICLFPRPAGDASAESRPDIAGRPLRDTRVSTRGNTTPASDDAGIAAAEAQTPGESERDRTLGAAVTETAAADPLQALRLASQIDESESRGEAIGFALAQLAATDPDAVFAWLETSGESEETHSLAERNALPALAEEDPARVARWIADGHVSARNQASVVVATVQRWTQQDPPAAAAWVADFGDDRLLRGAMEPLLALWTRRESAAPAVWIGTLPAGPVRDEACAAYAAALAHSAPAEAARWAEEIGSPRLFAATIKRLGGE